MAALAATTTSAQAAAPTVEWTRISSPTTTSVILEAEVTTGEKASKYHFEYDIAPYGEGGPAHGTATPKVNLAGGESPKTISATIAGLAPGGAYHFRAVIENAEAKSAKSPDRPFYTYSQGPGGLPEARAYEQASPVDKDGGDVTGTVPFVKAALDGHGVTFASTSGIPGGEGAQELPLYLGSRIGEGAGASWSTGGLLPPASAGDKAKVLGWSPDFARFYVQATKFGLSSRATALFSRPASATPLTQITPYVSGAGFAYVGQSADGSVALFESRSAQLGSVPPGVEGHSNVYAWDGSKLSLASVFNDGAPAQGAFAGPYEWLKEKTTEGGAANLFYLQDERALSQDGSVFFTEAGSGHIYLRENPTQPQSALDAGGECAEAAKACTIDVSPSVRAEPDSAGERPRAFQAASANGQSAFFTSPEELTDDANTGPEVQGPAIGRATIQSGGEEEAEDVREEFLLDHHAVGVAVQGEYLYWADAVGGTIGRARLQGNEATEANDSYVSKEQIEVMRGPEGEEQGFAEPRYVAIGPCAEGGECIYWTNAADEKKESGTIGRAKLGGAEAEDAEAEFIEGASNPQGIAVNASHVYWANSLYTPTSSEDDIARAGIDGEAVEQHFFEMNNGTQVPWGVALDGTHVYFTVEGVASAAGGGFVSRIQLTGGGEEFIGIVDGGNPRGIALDATHAYWVAQGHKTIGRLPLAAFQPEGQVCETEVTGCDPEFLEIEGIPADLALASSHLYWSANGEIAPHPGNDLYRYSTQGKTLTDLTPEASAENGAEAQGVIGASEDGSRLYFIANGTLGGVAPERGDCNGLKGTSPKGQCNLYLWEADGSPKGSLSFVARLDANGSPGRSDARDWLPADANGVFQVAAERSSQLSADGETLLFASQQRLTPYDNEGVPQLYRFKLGEGIACVSCDPTGAPAGQRPSIGSIQPAALELASTTAVSSHNLSADGRRVFFQTTDPLAPEDENGKGEAGCPLVGGGLQQSELAGFYSCLDIYEWEAPGTGSCKAAGPGYSLQDEGCLYLLSSGKSDWATLFADASASGNDVFFFTREGLVGQDQDELLDVYDARVGGGIEAQNPTPKVPCESIEACHGPGQGASEEASPASPYFIGPPNPKPKRHKAKHHRRKRKHHHHRRKGGRSHRRAHASRAEVAK